MTDRHFKVMCAVVTFQNLDGSEWVSVAKLVAVGHKESTVNRLVSDGFLLRQGDAVKPK